ncbi:hypothetical protein N0V87_005918 [Didymella glomerata]|uniref:Cytochrome P450 n=1 Tax=Didymella glomerata TaxID=749621 RepID=A0A9W9BYZ9_9PLEO|nr:hypothetical protein N0V87_005918 [Didymella glomerata]
MTNRYGSLARIGPNELVTSDTDVLRKIMSVRSAYSRGPWYDAWKLEAGKDNLFCMRDEVAHIKLRNRMTAGYSGKENDSMEHTIEIQVANLVKLVRSKYISSNTEYRPDDLAQKLQYFTLDVISDLAFGKPLGYLQNDADPFDYVEAMNASMPVLASLGNVPWLANLFHSPLLRRFLPSEKDKGGFGAVIGFSKRIVTERFRKSARTQRDMLASFIRHGLNETEASGEALLQVVAGADTTATGLKTVMLSLMTNPEAYRRLQTEIENGISKGTISAPMKDSEARQLPYLQAVIKEGLRIRSPAGGAFFKMVPPAGDMINGLFVPGGTQIGVSHLSFLHSEEVFGPDAQVLRLERWLDPQTDPGHISRMNCTLDMIFHSGKYQCLGKSVALMEFNKVFVELLRTFDFSIVNTEKPALITNAGVWLIKGFWVRVTSRQ